MASSIGLAFQLSAIDCTRTHFVSGDLTLEEMNAQLCRVDASGEPGVGDGPAARVVFGVVQGSPKLRVLASSLIIQRRETLTATWKRCRAWAPGWRDCWRSSCNHEISM